MFFSQVMILFLNFFDKRPEGRWRYVPNTTQLHQQLEYSTFGCSNGVTMLICLESDHQINLKMTSFGQTILENLDDGSLVLRDKNLEALSSSSRCPNLGFEKLSSPQTNVRHWCTRCQTQFFFRCQCIYKISLTLETVRSSYAQSEKRTEQGTVQFVLHLWQ